MSAPDLAASAPRANEAPAQRLVILSVDDEPNISRPLKRTLRPLGAEVLTCTNGADHCALKLTFQHA